MSNRFNAKLPVSLQPIRPLCLNMSEQPALLSAAVGLSALASTPISRSPSPLLHTSSRDDQHQANTAEDSSDSSEPSDMPALVDIASMEVVKDSKKRRRTTPQELATLEANFLQNPLPDLASRQKLAKKLAMTPRAVQIWFQNRRQKEKKLPVTERVLIKLPSPSEYSNYSLRDLPFTPAALAAVEATVAPRPGGGTLVNAQTQAQLLKLPSITALTVERPIITRSNSAPASTSSIFGPARTVTSGKAPLANAAQLTATPIARPPIKRQTSQTYTTDDDGQAFLPPLNLADQHSPKGAGPVPPIQPFPPRMAPSLKRAHSAFSGSHATRPIFIDDEEEEEMGYGEGRNEHSPGSDANLALLRKRQKLMQEAQYSHLKITTSPFLYNMSSSKSDHRLPSVQIAASSSPTSATSQLRKECGKLSLGFLLQAAQHIPAYPREEEMEASTDEETAGQAHAHGGKGNESFSSIDSEGDDMDESREEAALLLGLLSGR